MKLLMRTLKLIALLAVVCGIALTVIYYHDIVTWAMGLFLKHPRRFMFVIIFLQEIGVPIPAFNETLLMSFGTIAHAHVIPLGQVLVITTAASMLAGWILFLVFYLFGNWIMKNLPFLQAVLNEFLENVTSARKTWIRFLNWLILNRFPAIKRPTESLLQKNSNHQGLWTVVFGRLLVPFGRGWTCIAVGLMGVSIRQFFWGILISDIAWNNGFVMIGYSAGNAGQKITSVIGGAQNVFLFLFLIFVAYTIGNIIYNKIKSGPTKKTQIS